MNKSYYIRGKKLNLKPKQIIAKGGEAEIYDLHNGMVAKIFKPSSHPDYTNLPHEQASAAKRIKAHQQKLLKFPQQLPSNCLTPQEIIKDSSGQIVGYTMPFIENALPLLKYSDRQFRIQSGISNQEVFALFLQLRQLLLQIHQAGIIIGDFNDLNILIKEGDIYLIDTDSWQFAEFPCNMFTKRFVDPILCDRSSDCLILTNSYNHLSDWYSFTVMLFQCLLFVDPYGGIHKPSDPQHKFTVDQRILKRITVFHPEVQYPKPAISYRILSQSLLNFFQQVFIHDRREVFPQELLATSWQKCSICNLEHQHITCPICQDTPVHLPKHSLSNLTATYIFHTKGVILDAQLQGNNLAYIYYEQGCFYRENGFAILHGQLNHQIRFSICDRHTLIFQNQQLAVIAPDQNIQMLSATNYAVNSHHYYWICQEQLLRSGDLGAVYIGDVIGDHTRFWVGEAFGLGFYSVGNILITFVFDALLQGINDQVRIPIWHGELIDYNCIFAQEICWLFLKVSEHGNLKDYCHIVHRTGKVLTSQEVSNLELGSFYMACAFHNYLFIPTDAGIQRWQMKQSSIHLDKTFIETTNYVNATTKLLISPQGIVAVNEGRISLLQCQ